MFLKYYTTSYLLSNIIIFIVFTSFSPSFLSFIMRVYEGGFEWNSLTTLKKIMFVKFVCFIPLTWVRDRELKIIKLYEFCVKISLLCGFYVNTSGTDKTRGVEMWDLWQVEGKNTRQRTPKEGGRTWLLVVLVEERDVIDIRPTSQWTKKILTFEDDSSFPLRPGGRDGWQSFPRGIFSDFDYHQSDLSSHAWGGTYHDP